MKKGLGDPSRGSTGAHEFGINATGIYRVPLRKGILPTVTLLDGSIANAPERVMEIIGDAKEYAKRFIP
ncbi:hypothetical protein [Paenibacillus sp.]|uniref:hypothetical protein n=1 Tax=Paenibacillus sp. TaxID=58172 RepID=UPI002D5F63AA|nr:hypothetical protein [Paenibacillus sp.]HZG55127.1 hypothetical protein [Paenibacillus sp.]